MEVHYHAGYSDNVLVTTVVPQTAADWLRRASRQTRANCDRNRSAQDDKMKGQSRVEDDE
jgi:hypothetical protein